MEEAKALFVKLKIHTLLDLALIVPSAYSDTTLSKSLELGSVNTLEVKVINSSVYAGKLRVNFSLDISSRQLSSTFFRATPYHHKLFEVGSHHVVQGRLEEYKGYLQMPQPKSINKQEIGKITPKYKTALKESDMRSLVECYVGEQNLYNEGLDSKEIATILDIHFPKSIDKVYDNGHLKKEHISILKFIEAYNHIKKLRNKRVDFVPIHPLTGSADSFIKALPFTLTDEQVIVIDEIKIDLARDDKATKRMVVGDVGSGKTMVILSSVMMALPYKSILMAPTSLLAIQLYEEATKYLPKEVKIALVMQCNSKGDYANADFVIGTHAILYKDDLPKASLVMVDEQHRFGTKQRHTLETLVSSGDKKPHFIQFSATPIPRTQAMMDSELLDVSLITTTPFKREVDTKTISKNDFKDLLVHIEDEVNRGHQVLIVYPLVEMSTEIPYQSIAEGREFWEKKFNGVYVTHGKDKKKEEVLLEFREKGSILLATTVIEVGISLPKLTVAVIVGAERLGLATLHQLRGRVGRNGLKSWCYLYSNHQDNFRLEQFTKTTSGFDIAKLDLKFRNSGDILDGTIQSGEKFSWLDMAEDESTISYAKDRLAVLTDT